MNQGMLPMFKRKHISSVRLKLRVALSRLVMGS